MAHDEVYPSIFDLISHLLFHFPQALTFCYSSIPETNSCPKVFAFPASSLEILFKYPLFIFLNFPPNIISIKSLLNNAPKIHIQYHSQTHSVTLFYLSFFSHCTYPNPKVYVLCKWIRLTCWVWLYRLLSKFAFILYFHWFALLHISP